MSGKHEDLDAISDNTSARNNDARVDIWGRALDSAPRHCAKEYAEATA